MAKKRFGIDQTTHQALSQTMQMAKDHDSYFTNTEILISKIELDPENPRKHKITRDDLPNGPSNKDQDYEIKNREYEGLCELAASIQKDGLLHPVVVYKRGDNYRLVAGERRFLATILAKKSQIEARVYKNKPKAFDLKVVQWMENESRKDLSLYNKLMNVAAIIEAFNEESAKAITAIKLSEILSMSRPSAQFYVAVLGNPFLMKLIEKGEITTLREARGLANIQSEEGITQALKANQMPPNESNKKPLKLTSTKKQNGVFSLGSTQNSHVPKTIVESVLATKPFKKYSSLFAGVNWDSAGASKKAFKKLIGLMEKEV